MNGTADGGSVHGLDARRERTRRKKRGACDMRGSFRLRERGGARTGEPGGVEPSEGGGGELKVGSLPGRRSRACVCGKERNDADIRGGEMNEQKAPQHVARENGVAGESPNGDKGLAPDRWKPGRIRSQSFHRRWTWSYLNANENLCSLEVALKDQPRIRQHGWSWPST